MPRCWITPPSIGLDHALVMRLADYVLFPGFVLNGVPVVFPFFTPLSSRGMICQRGWKVPNGHSCKQRTSPLNPRVEDKKKKKKMTSILMFVSLFCGFHYFSLNEQKLYQRPNSASDSKRFLILPLIKLHLLSLISDVSSSTQLRMQRCAGGCQSLPVVPAQKGAWDLCVWRSWLHGAHRLLSVFCCLLFVFH